MEASLYYKCGRRSETWHNGYLIERTFLLSDQATPELVEKFEQDGETRLLVSQTWHSRGKRAYARFYTAGKCHLEEIYDQDGNLTQEIIYYRSGNKCREVYYKNGKRHRDKYPAYTLYDENGDKVQERYYKDGKQLSVLARILMKFQR